MTQLDLYLELDEDGYPTLEFLETIKNYPYTEQGYEKLLDFIQGIWHHAWWGWKKSEPVLDYYIAYNATTQTKRTKIKYKISTAGWSGNEDIIRALEANSMFWDLCWVSSRRGGHYEFEIQILEEN